MKNGTFVIFIIQRKTVAKSPWLKPDGKMSPVAEHSNGSLLSKPTEEQRWGYVSCDTWNRLRHKGSNVYKWDHPEIHKESEVVYNNTSEQGFLKLASAMKGVKILRKMDSEGEFDCRDGYGKKEQSVRHEYRIVKKVITHYCEVTPVTVDDVIAAV